MMLKWIQILFYFKTTVHIKYSYHFLFVLCLMQVQQKMREGVKREPESPSNESRKRMKVSTESSTTMASPKVSTTQALRPSIKLEPSISNGQNHLSRRQRVSNNSNTKSPVSTTTKEDNIQTIDL